MNNDAISALRAALELSPNNPPLRLHLAETLFSMSRFEEAQKEYTAALLLEPDNKVVQVGLAGTFYQLGKYMQALVIAEDLLAGNDCPAAAYILHARLLLNEGQSQKAASQYKRGIEIDPALIDVNLADRLGLSADEKPEKVRAQPVGARGQIGREEDNENDQDGDEGLFAEESRFESGLEVAKIKFEDVGGMDKVKEQIQTKIIFPLTNPDIYKAYGKKIGGGILMYGPPGCGKTHLARATAGEINAGFINVAIVDIMDMWLGNSEKNLHMFFQAARRNKPCVLFFDEVDALAAKRVEAKISGHHVINQFLSELDGIEKNNDGVLILAATNAPWHLDSAFRRPGRFDRIVFVPPPDKAARAAILRIMMLGKPSQNIDFEHLAQKTENFSGADLHALVDVTLEKKIEQAMKANDGVPSPVTTKDLEAGLKQVKPSTAEWFAMAKNYALYSNESGIYDDIRKYMKI